MSTCTPNYSAAIGGLSQAGRWIDVDLADWKTISWTRAADETTPARVTLRGCDPNLAGIVFGNLGNIELRVWRNDDEVWTGPIHVPRIAGDDLTITARDPSYWLTRRDLWADFTNTGTPPEIAETALIQGLSTTGPPVPRYRRDSGLILPNLTVTPGGESVEYTIDAPGNLAEILDDLVELGLTWTFRGYQMFLGTRPLPGTRPTVELSVGDMHPQPDIEASLDDLVTIGTAYFDKDDTFQIRHAYLADRYGPDLPVLEEVIDAGDTTNTGTLTRLARAAIRYPAPLTIVPVDGATLKADVDVSQMIPGRVVWTVPVSTALFEETIPTQHILESVTFTAERAGAGQTVTETIEVSTQALQPTIELE
jgi:hypothetical protein